MVPRPSSCTYVFFTVGILRTVNYIGTSEKRFVSWIDIQPTIIWIRYNDNDKRFTRYNAMQLVKKWLYTFLTECADARPKLFKLHYTPLHTEFEFRINCFKCALVNNIIILCGFRFVEWTRSWILQNTEYVMTIWITILCYNSIVVRRLSITGAQPPQR